MSLSPLATPFFSCPNVSAVNSSHLFLQLANSSLSKFDARLFSEILNEWESAPLISDCFKVWSTHCIPPCTSKNDSFHILSFNVRGLDRRFDEVILLANSYAFDIIILLETGFFEDQKCKEIFSEYRMYYQQGENANGGVIILIKLGISHTRIDVSTPNVCAIDIQDETTIRIIGVYAPESKKWVWDELSHLITNRCVFFGDFNIDLELDKSKASPLLNWADSNELTPCITELHTSLRSKRKIDYAFASGFSFPIQTYEKGTNSDHKPILSSIPKLKGKLLMNKNIHWKVFNLMCEFTLPFWENQWSVLDIDSAYGTYTKFIGLLTDRCTIHFEKKKYRLALPETLRLFMSKNRALSFKQMRTGDALLKETVKSNRNIIRFELKNFLSTKVKTALKDRNMNKPSSVTFWSKIKNHMKSNNSSLIGFSKGDDGITKNPQEMCEIAAAYYESFFKSAETFFRPHPYTDSNEIDCDNWGEEIPPTSINEIIEVVRSRKKKKSCDAHNISNITLANLPSSYWGLMAQIFNRSFERAEFPSVWKDTRILLLAKKEAICTPDKTRPISLLDVFLKVNEKLFQVRFNDVLERRGILPLAQSGFRANRRLQSRVLLFLDQLGSLMANSTPIATVFVDFKAAFDQLWFDGCIGKLKKLGIPQRYINWIKTWLHNRRAFIEIAGVKSRWFEIQKGCPQGSVLSPSLFISYHADMDDELGISLNHFYADDMAAIVAGDLGRKFSLQCIELERKLKIFFDKLEYYTILTAQPINYDKTEAMWTARAIGNPKFEITAKDKQITWVKNFKYLGYWFTPKLGFGLTIEKCKTKVRQRMGLINSFKFSGQSSLDLRKCLFLSYVLPIFAWIFPIIPLLTKCQQNELSHFYLTCLKRIHRCMHLTDANFLFESNEITLERRCRKYWDKYLEALAENEDGELLIREAALNIHRESWLDVEYTIQGLHRSKRLVKYTPILVRILRWCAGIPIDDSGPNYDIEEFLSLALFPETF